VPASSAGRLTAVRFVAFTVGDPLVCLGDVEHDLLALWIVHLFGGGPRFFGTLPPIFGFSGIPTACGQSELASVRFTTLQRPMVHGR